METEGLNEAKLTPQQRLSRASRQYTTTCSAMTAASGSGANASSAYATTVAAKQPK